MVTRGTGSAAGLARGLRVSVPRPEEPLPSPTWSSNLASARRSPRPRRGPDTHSLPDTSKIQLERLSQERFPGGVTRGRSEGRTGRIAGSLGKSPPVTLPARRGEPLTGVTQGWQDGSLPLKSPFWSPTHGWVCSCHPPNKLPVLFSKPSSSDSNLGPGGVGGGGGGGGERRGSLKSTSWGRDPKIPTAQV